MNNKCYDNHGIDDKYHTANITTLKISLRYQLSWHFNIMIYDNIVILPNSNLTISLWLSLWTSTIWLCKGSIYTNWTIFITSVGSLWNAGIPFRTEDILHDLTTVLCKK